MKLYDNLYTISSREENAFLISLIPSSVIYSAHFPELPVTPGVCIIQIASELLECILGKKVSLTEVTNAKFLSVINPETARQVSYNFTKISSCGESRTIKANVMVSSPTEVFAKLSLLYSIDE